MPREQGLKELPRTPATLPHPCTHPGPEAAHASSQLSAWGGGAGPAGTCSVFSFSKSVSVHMYTLLASVLFLETQIIALISEVSIFSAVHSMSLA